MKDISTTQTRDNIERVMQRLAETAPAMARFRAALPDAQPRRTLADGRHSVPLRGWFGWAKGGREKSRPYSLKPTAKSRSSSF